MELQVLQWFEETGLYAVWISLILNVIISILGFIPSVFITAANINFFGFGHGLLISILGEALGAIISFGLYRTGITKVKDKISLSNKYLGKLQNTTGMEAFWLILILRIFPFAPSGLVTLASAYSRVGLLNFSVASTLGKIPALGIEAYSIYQIIEWDWQGKVILGSLLIFFFYLVKKHRLWLKDNWDRLTKIFEISLSKKKDRSDFTRTGRKSFAKKDGYLFGSIPTMIENVLQKFIRI